MQKQAVYDKERDICKSKMNIAMNSSRIAISTASVSAAKTITVPMSNATLDPIVDMMESIIKKLSELTFWQCYKVF